MSLLTNITSFSFHNFRPQGESRVLPFSERTCDLLEAQYKLSVEQGQWGKRFDLPSEDKRGGSDVFIFNSPQVI